jgi:hypothetical protein
MQVKNVERKWEARKTWKEVLTGLISKEVDLNQKEGMWLLKKIIGQMIQMK